MSDDTAIKVASRRRLGVGGFGSALSSADYNASLAAGLEPVGLVIGTYVANWAWYGPGSPYGGATPVGSGSRVLKRRYYKPGFRSPRYRAAYYQGASRPNASIATISPNRSEWPCLHGMPGEEHRTGVNFEQEWIEAGFLQGYQGARDRMLAEAGGLRAHGVIGVVDEITTPSWGVRAFQLRGTAVRVRGERGPSEVWSTYLAGERLVKLVEAGWAPVSVVAALASVRIWPACSTEDMLDGAWPQTQEMSQIEAAHRTVRSLARLKMHQESGADDIHGVRYEVAEHRIAHGDDEVTCTVWGSRIRRYAPPERMAAPRPTVSLA